MDRFQNFGVNNYEEALLKPTKIIALDMIHSLNMSSDEEEMERLQLRRRMYRSRRAREHSKKNFCYKHVNQADICQTVDRCNDAEVEIKKASRKLLSNIDFSSLTLEDIIEFWHPDVNDPILSILPPIPEAFKTNMASEFCLQNYRTIYGEEPTKDVVPEEENSDDEMYSYATFGMSYLNFSRDLVKLFRNPLPPSKRPILLNILCPPPGIEYDGKGINGADNIKLHAADKCEASIQQEKTGNAPGGLQKENSGSYYSATSGFGKHICHPNNSVAYHTLEPNTVIYHAGNHTFVTRPNPLQVQGSQTSSNKAAVPWLHHQYTHGKHCRSHAITNTSYGYTTVENLKSVQSIMPRPTYQYNRNYTARTILRSGYSRFTGYNINTRFSTTSINVTKYVATAEFTTQLYFNEFYDSADRSEN